MFKNGPFKSKSIVGRVVEVEGNGIDENENSNNSLKSSNSVQKSTISSSVSKIFGASPYKKSSTTRTPGRKLLKKLICTPGKSRSFPDTSVSDIEDFPVIPNNTSTGLTVSHSCSSDETKETGSSVIQTSNLGPVPSSPPRLARKLLEDNETYSNNVIRTVHMMKSPTRSQNPQISSGLSKSKNVDDALLAASNRSGFSEDMIFLTNSSSDDEFDHRNESESDSMTRMKSSSPYASPRQFERYSSPSRAIRVAMKPPGMSIPTPAMPQQRQTSNGCCIGDFCTESGPQFPHPLRSMPDSPMDKMNTTTPNPKNLSTQFEECEDDEAAFLPDDFNVISNNSTQDKVTFTMKEVEQKILEARREERITLRKQHDREIEESRLEYEKVLHETQTQWKQDADEQELKLRKQLKEERHKTSQKHHELINKAQSLQDVSETLKETKAERELLNLRVRDLETSAEKMSIAASNNDYNTKEIESLREDKKKSEQRISKLETELSEAMGPLKREKEISDQKAADLLGQLRILSESSDQSQNQLEEALKEIALLKGQLAEMPSIDPEEVRTSKLEVENLRNLRAEDGKEILALQNQLSKMVDEHRDVITPQKKLVQNEHCESPCVGEIDMLRVNYDRAQDQLKSMGKVLKRYKAERDDLKTTIQESEQLHVQSIEIAVKQATQDQKERVQLLIKENEALRQQPKDIGEKMVEEMKKHMEDTKRKHEQEIVRLRETLKQLRSEHNEQLCDAKLKSKKEIDSLQNELRQAKMDVENERTNINKTKSREFEALEDQIKSMHEMHSEELELVVGEYREEVNSLKRNINELQKELDAKSSTEDAVEKMKSDFEEAFQMMKEKTKAEKDCLATQIDSLQVEKDAEARKASLFETQIREIQTKNAETLEKVKSECDLKIRELKSEHGRESDELLTQLDLIEAESYQRRKNVEAAVMEKDAVITALGSQLAESEAKTNSSKRENEEMKEEIKSLRSDLEVVNASNEATQEEIATLIERHKREIEDEIALREGACNEAREEMIALAEGQLAERQEYYQALKRELDKSQSEISVLERDLRFAKKESEEISRRHEAREADLRDELAQSKAAIATKEANLIRAEKVHQVELDRARDAEKAMKSKFEESQKTSQTIQKTLAALVTDKQRLERELAEVTAISEELAELCEKNKLM